MSLTPPLWSLLAALPWLLVPVIIFWRLRDSTMLHAYAAEPPVDAPLVSVVLPVRNEARNIEACLRSILSTGWPHVEVIVVNDHSSDETGVLARRLAETDTRVRVIENPALPEGWFGKQWACWNGAKATRGTLLLFTDADTRHAPDLIPRSVRALVDRRADLLSVLGGQTLESFWERLVQPQVFAILLSRYGGTDAVSRSTNPYRKIANGQYMLMRREAYERTGGHETVRTHVAEDLRLAQEWCRMGLQVHLVVGLDQLTTRMYHGLGEIVRGWGKNVYAGGRDTLPLGRVGQWAFRVLFPVAPLWYVVPAVVTMAGTAGHVSPAAGLWGLMAYAIATVVWGVAYRAVRQPIWYAPLHPVGAAVVFGIFLRAAWKGERVEWKGRAYRSR